MGVLEVGASWPVLQELDTGSQILVPPPDVCLTTAAVPAAKHAADDAADANCPTSKNVALVLRGITFSSRLGNATSSGHMQESMPDQLRAAFSHLRYIVEPLEASGDRVDVFGATY